ncbi:putative RNA-directed DNA polymerase, eukaryota, reverse transcriptase zinc-binding domain protein [Tanacetum coccineum]
MITIEMLSKTCFFTRNFKHLQLLSVATIVYKWNLLTRIGGVCDIAVEASMEDEIVILEGDYDNDEADNLSSGEFNKMIVSEWNGRKEQIEAKDDLVMRNESLKVLSDLDRLEAKDLAQKAKVKWAVEEPVLVKANILDHFQKRFAHFKGPRPGLGLISGNDYLLFTLKTWKFPFLVKRLNERCGIVVRTRPQGTILPFIALIPKVSDPKVVSDFRPISLIGCQYKIIGKLLANLVSLLIGECVNSEQSAFIKGSNILDGPLILNEVMERYWERKSRLMIFKVDFEKAYDSLR